VEADQMTDEIKNLIMVTALCLRRLLYREGGYHTDLVLQMEEAINSVRAAGRAEPKTDLTNAS
jgi:hypothetical protein